MLGGNVSVILLKKVAIIPFVIRYPYAIYTVMKTYIMLKICLQLRSRPFCKRTFFFQKKKKNTVDEFSASFVLTFSLLLSKNMPRVFSSVARGNGA